jgi:heme-degrading monooxygenase HmoA
MFFIERSCPMFCIINQSHAKAGEEPAFEDMYKALLESGRLSEVPGFIAAYFLRPNSAGETHQTVMLWQDETSWKAFLRSERARQSLGNLDRSLTSAPPRLDTFVVLGSWKAE